MLALWLIYRPTLYYIRYFEYRLWLLFHCLLDLWSLQQSRSVSIPPTGNTSDSIRNNRFHNRNPLLNYFTCFRLNLRSPYSGYAQLRLSSDSGRDYRNTRTRSSSWRSSWSEPLSDPTNPISGEYAHSLIQYIRTFTYYLVYDQVLLVILSEQVL